MKISSASKKVLASALSAAMVVAFAPTVAFAAATTGTKATVDNYTDEAAVADGYVAKQSAADGTYYFTLEQFKTAMSGGENVGGYTLIADINEAISVDTTKGAITLNLNGHTIANSEDDFIVSSNAAQPTVTVSGANKATIKNGTVKAVKTKAAVGTADKDATSNAAVYVANATAATNVALEGVTAGDVDTDADVAASGNAGTTLTVSGGTYGAVEAASLTVKGEVSTGAIDADTAVAKAAKLTATTNAKKADQDGTAIDGDVTVAEGATVTASATTTAAVAACGIRGDVKVAGKDATVAATAVSSAGAATAILGDVCAYDSANSKYYTGVKVTAQAKTTADGKDADGIAGGVNAESVEASADSAYGVATGIKAEGSAVSLSGGSVSASGADAAKSVALSGTGDIAVSGGSFDGKLGLASQKGISGGTFTDDPTNFIVNSSDYDVTYAGGLYTVSQFKAFSINEKQNAEGTAGYTFLQGALQTIAAGGTVSGVSYAEGWDAAKMLEFAKGEGAGKLYVKVTTKAYAEKTATDAQKAAKKAVDEAVKADLQYTDDTFYKTVTVQVVYDKQGAVEPVVVADVTDMGTKVVGTQAKDNTIDVANNGVDTVSATAWQYIDGKAEKTSFKDSNKNGKHEAGETTVSFRYVPVLVTSADIDQEAVKDAASKVTPDTPAAEKATQSIEVDQKSKTVKLAKKATKTKKAFSFNLGATAQTGLTIAKASGSSKVTVSDSGKVTLKKGAKKGTYKATVTINAAATDAYYAAAKTVTVKFVVKK